MVKSLPSNAGDAGSIPGQGTRSHMHAATKSSHAATKTRSNQKKKKKKSMLKYTVEKWAEGIYRQLTKGKINI